MIITNHPDVGKAATEFFCTQPSSQMTPSSNPANGNISLEKPLQSAVLTHPANKMVFTKVPCRKLLPRHGSLLMAHGYKFKPLGSG